MNKEEIVVQKLIDKEYHISCAESCTGGMLSSRIVNVPNASMVLDASIVTYANAAKIKYLGVNPITIDTYGVVSEQVAGEMAQGIAKEQQAQVGIGISGIAGPSGGTPAKPVGMVCFGIYLAGRLLTYTMQFGNIGRLAVREKSVDFVFDKLIELL